MSKEWAAFTMTKGSKTNQIEAAHGQFKIDGRRIEVSNFSHGGFTVDLGFPYVSQGGGYDWHPTIGDILTVKAYVTKSKDAANGITPDDSEPDR